MADLPIPFSGPMVCALLREIEQPGTGKTQTRRVVDMPPIPFDAIFNDDGVWHIGDALTGHRYAKLPVRYRVGDRLYVREHWRTHARLDHLAPREMIGGADIAYEANGNPTTTWGRFRQGMHMPRWASRITLTVTEVRVQRLQEISEADAKAEGTIRHRCGSARNPWWTSHRTSFEWLWDSLHGFDAWDANPWVVAVSFTVRLGNIDAGEGV